MKTKKKFKKVPIVNNIQVVFAGSFKQEEKEIVEKHLKYVAYGIGRRVFFANRLENSSMIGLKSDNGMYEHNVYLSELKGEV